jgi:RND family efflux transporter MFP subunit
VSDLKSELEGLRIERDRPAVARRWPLLFLLPVVLGLGLLYGLKARQGFGAPEVRTVQSATAPAGDAATGAPVLTASGYVVARRKAVVSAKIQGRLAELRVEEGSRAREGEVIARLESTDYEAQVERSRAGVDRAQADLAENQRQLRLAQDLSRQSVMARNEMEAAESRVRIAEAALGQARAELAFSEAQLQNTLIRAPFTGVVVKKMAEVGESVAPIPPGVTISSASGAIVALADLDTLEVEADVAEANVAKLGADQPAEVTVEAFPGRRYRAVLRQVIPTADRTKATVQVKVTILDEDKDLKPEMSARVQFLEPQPRAGAAAPAGPPPVLVPKEAVATRHGKTVVFEVRDGAVRQRAVETAGERGEQLVVRQGLSGGEVLVARPPETLKDGDRVRIKG